MRECEGVQISLCSFSLRQLLTSHSSSPHRRGFLLSLAVKVISLPPPSLFSFSIHKSRYCRTHTHSPTHPLTHPLTPTRPSTFTTQTRVHPSPIHTRFSHDFTSRVRNMRRDLSEDDEQVCVCVLVSLKLILCMRA